MQEQRKEKIKTMRKKVELLKHEGYTDDKMYETRLLIFATLFFQLKLIPFTDSIYLNNRNLLLAIQILYNVILLFVYFVGVLLYQITVLLVTIFILNVLPFIFNN